MTASQLSKIESNCPQVVGKTEDIWRALITKDFPHMVIPRSNFRKTYDKYYKEQQKQLNDASIRLKQAMKRLEQEKASTTITALEVDPISLKRANRKRGYGSSSGASGVQGGSSIMKKALQSARSRGPIFSKKNVQFIPNNSMNGVENTRIHRDDQESYMKPPRKKQRRSNENIDALFNEKLSHKSPETRPDTAKPAVVSPKSNRERKNTPSIFLPKKKR